MIVPMIEILKRAKEGGYSVIAPNVSNDTTVKAAFEAASECNSPLILDCLYIANDNPSNLAKIIYDLDKMYDIPVAINQDHGSTFEQALKAIQAGFTSIMVDRSELPFEENIAEVKQLVDIAHTLGITVESELGHVGDAGNYSNDRDAGLTDPSVAKEFVERTGIDCLAVAIGTAHGIYKGEPHIDFERLEEIKKVVDIPLVLHGGSGTGEENLAKAAKSGIQKINISTDLYRAAIDNATGKPHYLFFDEMKEGYKEKLKHYMTLTGQIGKAWK